MQITPDCKQELDSDPGHQAAPDGQVPTAVCEQPSVEVAGAAPTEQETPATHTPGPWYTRDAGDFNYPRIEILRDVIYVEGTRPTTYLIGSVTYPTTTGYPRPTVGSVERQANARLIAAAPELLEALQSLYTDAADYITLNKLGGMDNHSMKLARSAIASATGEKA